jgi:hypothetical protein
MNFVVPVRHHSTVDDWEGVVRRMAHTFASLEAQTSDSWAATIVANTGTRLPEMSEKFRTVRVDLPPAFLPDERRQRAHFYAAVRTDKGKRVLSGLLEGVTADFIMLLDYDDFVHRDLVRFVSNAGHENGWLLDAGFVFDGGKRVLLYEHGFNHLCGSSHIVRADAYRISPDHRLVDEAYVRRALGSHRFIAEDLAREGRPLARLPFPGAIYRIGHPGNTSSSSSIARTFFKPASSIRHPIRMLRRLAALRTIDAEMERDYFAGDFRSS